MILFFLFVIIPIVEIALLINIGGALGTPLTLTIILVTALIGSISLRHQGAVVWRRLSRLNIITLPDLLSHGLLLMLAGVFLITPGFLTDAFGLLLLIPPVRDAVARYLLKNARINLHPEAHSSGSGQQHYPDPPSETANEEQHGAASEPSNTSHSPWSNTQPKRPKRRSAEDATILDKKNDRT